MKTTQELYKVYAELHGVKTEEAKFIVDRVFAAVLFAMNDSGDRVGVRGFGRFEVYTTKKEKCRNPRTQEPVELPERKLIRFIPSRKVRYV